MQYILKTTLTLCALLFSTLLFSQDDVVNVDNDTIFGKIIELNDDFIRFETVNDQGIKTTSSIKTEYISSYNYSEIPVDELAYESSPIKKNAVRISFGGGYAGRLGKLLKTGDSAIDALSSDLRHGYALEGDFHFYSNFKEKNSTNFGPAINFNYINSSAETYTTPHSYSGEKLKASQSIIYIGPGLAMCSNYENWVLTGSLGLGALFYTEKATLSGVEEKLTATVFATNLSFGVDHKISSNMGLGLKLSLSGGATEKVNYEGHTMDLGYKLSLTSWMASFILSYRNF
ncbi:MAG: hypothetical protein LIO93_00990 [Bacteroidales bacterium]|nr:hypothetical protein [Bacteroidales bacterium]